MARRLSQEEEEYKITVSLSRKGLNTLDKLKETSGYGSRGRTIEEAILTINELTESGKPVFTQFAIDMQKQGVVSQTTQSAMVGWYTIVFAKLTRFMSK
jgi:metal-responsive CopG/Arc/MetJ family transcriptional regulator